MSLLWYIWSVCMILFFYILCGKQWQWGRCTIPHCLLGITFEMWHLLLLTYFYGLSDCGRLWTIASVKNNIMCIVVYQPGTNSCVLLWATLHQKACTLPLCLHNWGGMTKSEMASSLCCKNYCTQKLLRISLLTGWHSIQILHTIFDECKLNFCKHNPMLP